MGKAELLIVGRIATLAGDDGFGWAEAIAIESGRVLAAGRLTDVEAVAGPLTRRLDLAPTDVGLPALTDAHLHLADAAMADERVDLTNAPDPHAALDLIALAAAQPAESPKAWLLGQSWDGAGWGTWPLASDLDRVTGDRPALFWSHDHHAVWVNHATLAMAGVDRSTPDPPGGLIRRLPDGSPAGTLHEDAVRLVVDRVPAPARSELEAAIVRYAGKLIRYGVVAVHDPGPTGRDPRLEGGFAAVTSLDAAGRLPIRVHASVRSDSLRLAIERGLRSGQPLVPDLPDPRVRMGWLKLFTDGAFGSRTAALLEPYEPDPVRGLPVAGERGVLQTEPPELARLVSLAAEAGIASMIHAIGDAAVRVALDAAQLAGRFDGLGPRHRLEHIQLLAPVDRDRFARLGVAASVQPGHLIGDAAMARAALGGRADRAGYPLGSLARLGVLLPFGSDAPVESADPWPGLAMAVTRRGSGWPPDVAAFGPQEALSPPRAVRAACLDAPLVAGETDRGRLVTGQRADLIVVPREALDEPVEAGGPLEHVRPSMVLIDGGAVFEA